MALPDFNPSLFAGLFSALKLSNIVKSIRDAAETRLASLETNAVQRGTVQLTSGVKTINTGITITANSKILLQLTTPSGTMGAKVKITGKTVGAPGTGAFTATAVDASGTTVTTDGSTYDYVIIG